LARFSFHQKSDRAVSQEKIAQTLTLLHRVWALFLIALYFAGFMDEYHFPGNREKPLEGEAILWNVQRVLFFGLMFVGFLIDLVQIREDRNKAFLFLLLSLLLGGFSSWISAFQCKILFRLFSIAPPETVSAIKSVLPVTGFI
jgi:hypothetical protein